jgi:hypothetical protein
MESGWRRRGKSVGREYSTHKPRHLLVPSRLLSLALPPRLPRARAFCKGQEKQSRKQEYPKVQFPRGDEAFPRGKSCVRSGLGAILYTDPVDVEVDIGLLAMVRLYSTVKASFHV